MGLWYRGGGRRVGIRGYGLLARGRRIVGVWLRFLHTFWGSKVGCSLVSKVGIFGSTGSQPGTLVSI